MGGGGRREPGLQRQSVCQLWRSVQKKAPRGTPVSDKCFSAVKTGPGLRGSARPPLSKLEREPLGFTAFPVCTVPHHCFVLQTPLCSENFP